MKKKAPAVDYKEVYFNAILTGLLIQGLLFIFAVVTTTILELDINFNIFGIVASRSGDESNVSIDFVKAILILVLVSATLTFVTYIQNQRKAKK